MQTNRSMTKYIGINIGPVIKTLSLARRPRELWSASYLFSFLMEYIVDEADKRGEIIAPKEWNNVVADDNLPVGLYPDRIYIRPNEGVVADDILKPACDRFCKCLGVTSSYFNLMHTTCDGNSEVEAVTELNRRLDLLELCVQAPDSDPQEEIMGIIQEGKSSSLYKCAVGDDKDFSVETLAEISAAQLKMVVNEDIWKNFSSEARREDGKGDPYSVLGDGVKSFHRYFCVVQADGDNMGKTLTNESLKDGSISEISKALWQFGVNATKEIEEYAGMPIYAGGDDLLFLAPVRGKGSVSIFELLDKLEGSFQVVRDECRTALPELDDKDLPSLSFGVSICYYKHPLYEALESARHLLFDVAKEVNDKKAVAWKLEKHSGESFDACFSRKKTGLDEAFKNVAKQTVDGQTVTRAIHKCKSNWKLLTLCLQSDDNNRLDSFFKTILEETTQNRGYFDAVKKLMTELFNVQKPEDDDNLKKYSNTLYSMLRTAKFINGEDVKDE